MDRSERIKSMFDTSGFGLEIGPSYNPLLPKSEGYNVETVDHATADDLKEKYRTIVGAVERIEEVDHVSDGRPLSDQIGTANPYDFIFGSHVIEHVPDLVSFLQSCHALLKPAGDLVLAVPDKRFCFDIFRPLSSVGAVLQAYDEKRTRHTRATIFDHLFYYAKRGPQDVWIEPTFQGLHLVHGFDETLARTQAAVTTQAYTDAHAWVFVPASLCLIVDVLRESDLVEFYVGDIRRSDGLNEQHEFYVVLRKTGDGAVDYMSRLAELEMQLSQVQH